MNTPKKNGTYERIRPLIIWLGLTELAWIAYWLLSTENQPPAYMWRVAIWVSVMLVWMGGVLTMAMQGFFLRQTRLLSNVVGVTTVVTFACLLFAVGSDVYEGMVLAARSTSDVQLASIHILRLLAIGSVIKYLQGELPLHFILLGSLPDMLFAISAVVVTLLAATGQLEPNFLVAWHAIGFSAFMGAGISMFFSVPSPLRFIHSKPDTSIVFQFPMVLAPNFTVPLFMIAHLFALVKMLN